MRRPARPTELAQPKCQTHHWQLNHPLPVDRSAARVECKRCGAVGPVIAIDTAQAKVRESNRVHYGRGKGG